MVEEVFDCAAQELRPARRHEKAGLARNHDIRDRVDRGSDDRNVRLDRFDQCTRQTLITAGECEYVKCGEKFPDVIAVTQDHQAVVDSALAGVGDHLIAQRTIADPDAPYVGVPDRRQGVDPVLRCLLVVDPANRADEAQSGWEPEPATGEAASGRATRNDDVLNRRRDRAEALRHGDPSSHRLGGDAATHGQERMGAPAQPPFDPNVRGPAPRRLEVVKWEAVVGVHDSWNARRMRGHSTQRAGLGAVRMHHIKLAIRQ